MTAFAKPDTGAPDRERQERNADLPDFFKMKDLVGRHVLIKPVSIETIPGEGKWPDGRPKESYDRITADPVIVLDGRKNELFPELPRIQSGSGTWIFDNNVVAELRKPLEDGTPVLAYVGVDDRKRLVLEEADPAVEPLAQKAWAKYEGQESGQTEDPPF